MSTKSERQAAREEVAAYHEARLTELLQRVGEAIDRFRAGELDAFETDQTIFHFSRSAKELWKFCNDTDVVFTADWIRERAPADWWEEVRRTTDDVGAADSANGRFEGFCRRQRALRPSGTGRWWFTGWSPHTRPRRRQGAHMALTELHETGGRPQ
jgi:hypothetical protein